MFILLAEPHDSVSDWLEYDLPAEVGHGKKVVIKTVETRDGEVKHLIVDSYSVSERLCIVMSVQFFVKDVNSTLYTCHMSNIQAFKGGSMD